MIKPLEELRQLANLIYNAKIEGENTANRVGQAFKEIVEYWENFGLDKFLRKDTDDSASGIITFLKDIIVKGWSVFTKGWKTATYDGNGLYDHGAQVDENGNGILNSLFVRQFVSAPKFVFNEVNVTKSEQWNTNAYGTIEKVDTEKREITLHLEDNDYGSVEVGDICRGIFADIQLF